MNYQLDKNMIMMVQAFKQGCELAARKDDGKIDGEEKKQLKIIAKAVDNFIGELKKVSK